MEHEPTISVAEEEAGFKAVRHVIDATGYGGWVSDVQCKAVAYQVGIAMAKARMIKE